MKRAGLGILVAVVVAVLVVGVAAANPPSPLPANSAANDGLAVAGDASPAIDNGGVVAPPENVPFPQLPESQLTKIVFIRYAPGFQKDKPCDGDGVCEPGEKGWCSDCRGGGEPAPTATPAPTPAPTPASTCYDFLSHTQPSWNWVEDYYVDSPSLASASATAVTTWEGATSAEIFGGAHSGAGAWGAYDGKNSVTFGDYKTTGVLGVTAVWYRRGTIYEYDIMLDTDFFNATNGSSTQGFDLATVVLHELGHAAGLGDLYDTACDDQVMYGYVAPSETRTTLRDGDIAGIQVLYGP
jgi:hypothetical protein